MCNHRTDHSHRETFHRLKLAHRSPGRARPTTRPDHAAEELLRELGYVLYLTRQVRESLTSEAEFVPM